MEDGVILRKERVYVAIDGRIRELCCGLYIYSCLKC